MKIAVIGSGISGNSAAWALSRKHDITIYEKRNRLGGHSATVNVEHGCQTIPVDTGFIVYNEQNYPLLTRLFEHLDVATQPSRMSFSVSLDDGKLEWCGTKLKGVFAQPSNLFSPGFLRMLRDIFRFNDRARKDLQNGALCGLTLNDYLSKGGFSQRLKNDYLVPMTSAIWSTPSTKMLEFPAESLIRRDTRGVDPDHRRGRRGGAAARALRAYARSALGSRRQHPPDHRRPVRRRPTWRP